jgi:hypothetical protein
MDHCGAVDASACAFSAGSPEATRVKWAELLTRAKSGLDVDGETIDDRDVLTYIGGSLYTTAPLPGFGRFPGWPAVAQTLEAFWQAPAVAKTAEADGAPAEMPSASPAAAPAAASGEPYVTSAGRQLSVICGESPNPETAEAVAAQIQASYDRAGYSPWALGASCEGWAARATKPYLGPWDNPTPVPVLVIGNTFDPATPFAGSVRMGGYGRWRP